MYQGRRTVLVEAAWIAVEHHPLWKNRFERLADRAGKKKAIIAIARKLLDVLDDATIAAKTGLSEYEVAGLREDGAN